MADAFGDIDVLLVVEQGAIDALSVQWPEALPGTGEVVLWRDPIVTPALIEATLEDWPRVVL